MKLPQAKPSTSKSVVTELIVHPCGTWIILGDTFLENERNISLAQFYEYKHQVSFTSCMGSRVRATPHPHHALAHIPKRTITQTLNPKPELVSGTAPMMEVPYLQRELVGRLPDPVLGLHTVLPGQGHSRLVQAPVLLSLQLQDENLQRATGPGSVSFWTIPEAKRF